MELAEQFINMFDSYNSHQNDKNKVRIYSDKKIKEGDNWDENIQNAIQHARVVLFLISPDFLNSRYVKQKEIPRFLKSQTEDGLILVYVEIKPSIIPKELKKLQSFRASTKSGALSELNAGEQQAEIKKYCESIIERVLEYPRTVRLAFDRSVSEVALRRFGLTITKELATGDHSVVYAAEKIGHKQCVKARVRGLFEEDEEKSTDHIKHDIIESQKLCNPVFLKLVDWDLDVEPNILISEFCETISLKQILDKEIESRHHFKVDQIRFVFRQLASALGEYHSHGLVYGNLRPSDVLFDRLSKGRMFPRLSAYRASNLSLHWERGCNTFALNPERLSYLAPEQFKSKEITEKSDQYSLGLLTLEMLQDCAPVEVIELADLEKKKQFFKEPLGFCENGLSRSPILKPILLKMLSRNPKKRFPHINDILRDMGVSDDTEKDNRDIAKSIFQKIRESKNNDNFFKKFYKNLFSRNKKFKIMFEDKDMKIQIESLRRAVLLLLNFTESQSSKEPTTLTNIVNIHKPHSLSKRDFRDFEKAFIKTLDDFGFGNEETHRAWRSTFKPGMLYIKRSLCKLP